MGHGGSVVRVPGTWDTVAQWLECRVRGTTMAQWLECRVRGRRWLSG